MSKKEKHVTTEAAEVQDDLPRFSEEEKAALRAQLDVHFRREFPEWSEKQIGNAVALNIYLHESGLRIDEIMRRRIAKREDSSNGHQADQTTK